MSKWDFVFPQVCSTVKKKINIIQKKKIILVEEKASVHDKSTQKPGKEGNFLEKIIKNSFTFESPTCLQPSLSPSISPCAANEDAKLHLDRLLR